MLPLELPDQAPQPTAPEPRRKGLRTALAITALSGLAAAGGVAAAEHFTGTSGKDSVTVESTTPSNEARAAFIQELAQPKKGDKFNVARISLTLLKGASIQVNNSPVTVVENQISGIVNPAWVPAASGVSTELCYTSSPGNATCIEMNEANKPYIQATAEGSDGVAHEVAFADITPDTAVEVTTTDIDHGRAYADVNHQYIAAVPADFMPAPTSLPS